LRDTAIRLAEDSPAEALEVARAIPDPWFRCQALASAAFHSKPVSLRKSLVEEAFSAASELKDPYGVVAISAWPLKVITASGWHELIRPELVRLIDMIRPEPNSLQRAQALYQLVGAVHGGPEDCFLDAVRQFKSECENSQSWRIPWLIAPVVLLTEPVCQELAHGLVELVQRPRSRRKLHNRLARARERFNDTNLSWPNLH
jgi:hypothetical protein